MLVSKQLECLVSRGDLANICRAWCGTAWSSDGEGNHHLLNRTHLHHIYHIYIAWTCIRLTKRGDRDCVNVCLCEHTVMSLMFVTGDTFPVTLPPSLVSQCLAEVSQPWFVCCLVSNRSIGYGTSFHKAGKTIKRHRSCAWASHEYACLLDLQIACSCMWGVVPKHSYILLNIQT